MDLITLIPIVLAVLGATATAAWAILKAVAPLTKTTTDDEFIAEHGDAVEDILDNLDGEK